MTPRDPSNKIDSIQINHSKNLDHDEILSILETIYSTLLTYRRKTQKAFWKLRDEKFSTTLKKSFSRGALDLSQGEYRISASTKCKEYDFSVTNFDIKESNSASDAFHQIITPIEEIYRLVKMGNPSTQISDKPDYVDLQSDYGVDIQAWQIVLPEIAKNKNLGEIYFPTFQSDLIAVNKEEDDIDLPEISSFLPYIPRAQTVHIESDLEAGLTMVMIDSLRKDCSDEAKIDPITRIQALKNARDLGIL